MEVVDLFKNSVFRAVIPPEIARDQAWRKTLNVGIDPGVNTGLAFWSVDERRFLFVGSVSLLIAFEIMDDLRRGRVMDLAVSERRTNSSEIRVFIEDARLRRWFGSKEKGSVQGVGSVKRDCQLWESFCELRGLDFKLIHPRNNKTKTTAKTFEKLTKYTGRTNVHGRDAAMLAWGTK